ncbi:MAG: hypothetical protein MPN21_27930 [Thermoanaerobaculia bacterium]|nr:hypothetical protein [Thermoanaerobaculia bacterium]
MKRFAAFCVLAWIAVCPVPAFAQGEITGIPFDTIPGNVTIEGGGASIGLEADTEVAGDVRATGEMSSDVGYRFPDASLQTTAAASASVTGNLGLYGNTIAEMSPPNAYTEICIKGGTVLSDIHAGSESTAGGNCLPGDAGWIIERFERNSGAPEFWESARLECLKDGMRLPEVFEWKVACGDAALFALANMVDNVEWSANATISVGGAGGVFATSLGNGSCNWGSPSTVSNDSGNASDNHYRCAR